MRESTVKVALFSVDPAGLTTFHSFDPESFSIVSMIHDALVYIDTDGDVQPGLATSWRRVSPLEMEFTLREGVSFHNGEAFDADSVVETFRAHRLPTPSATGRGVLSPIVDVERVGAFTVRIRTAFPDAMLVRRLFCSSISPRGVLTTQGRDALAAHPIGTGPYRFVAYERGREIVLARNPGHWSGRATVDRLRFPIVRQKEWVDRLHRGEVDVALNIDSHDRVRAARDPGIVTASRQAAITQWFLLANRGPLANPRVRQALNHAINRRLLVDATAHGYGSPQRSVATSGQEGYTECAPYRYSPDLARRLLAEAGHASGLRLSGLVCETSTALYFMVREFLARVGVALSAEIVPRGAWIARVVGGNLHGEPYGGDFAVAQVDNPILHTLFHHFIFLFSHGPFALLRDARYDAEFLRASAALDPDARDEALGRIERYVRDEALVLFTIHEDVHAAWREGYSCELPRSGHFQMAALTTLRVDDRAEPSRTIAPLCGGDPDDVVLLDGTSHVGTFFLRPGATLAAPAKQRLWENLVTAEARWRLESEPMMRELVSQSEVRSNLGNVLSSTERVALAGYSAEGRRLYVNRGYAMLLGDAERSPAEHLGARWREIRAQVDDAGAWIGTVHLTSDGRPAGATDRLHLSVTRAVDDEGLVMGYAFVLQDFSGEEERIRHQAIRAILDHVPYGLLLCDADGRVRAGYSDACRAFFPSAAHGVEGRLLVELLEMPPRLAAHFAACHVQLFDDVMPESVSAGNLPPTVTVGGRTLSLSGAVVRDASGAVRSTLFTLIDVTDLTDARHEIEQLRGVITVLRHRDRFAEFALALHARLDALAGDLDAPDGQAAARRELHTAKGVLGQFGQLDLSREIHRHEDAARITPVALASLAGSLRALLARHEPEWGIRLDAPAPRYEVTESSRAELEARLRAASPEEAQGVALAWLARLREKTVGELVGPLAEYCASQSERVGKRVRFELLGAEVRCPPQWSGVFGVVPHLVRNCIDHGIEAPHARGDKPVEATVRLEVQANDNGLRICVSDDGCGVARDRVASRALSLGAVTEAELAAMSDAERLDLIFVEGLSTANDVSVTSGRGVGLGAVRAGVEALGGRLSLRSDAGRGTVFDIELSTAARR